MHTLLLMLTLAGLPGLADAAFLGRAWRAFAPVERPPLRQWNEQHIVNEQLRPFDAAAYPHLVAPGGPSDAWDDPRVRTTSLQFASRLGKTFHGQCCACYTADCDPAPMMFASSIEKLALEVVERTYKMLRARPTLARLLTKPPRFQRQDFVEFAGCHMFVAWARSASTLADKNVRVGHANEIDKWEHVTTSQEGDPLELFNDRFKDYWAVRKILYESTPTVAGRSRIEALRLAGWDCRYYVPCPHCGRYQVLRLGDGSPGGVKYDQPAGGARDPRLAQQTARYVCQYCTAAWSDHHRPWSFRRGVWIPAGCTPKDAEALAAGEASLAGRPPPWDGWQSASWISGTPDRDGPAASYQLSSLYALSLTWGDVASKYVHALERPGRLRNYVNQWLGDCWEQRRRQLEAELLQTRLSSGHPRGVCPPGTRFVTVTVDRQRAEGGFCVYTVLAHSLDERASLIDFGQTAKLEDLWQDVCRRHYPHADGGSLQPAAVAVDSGWDAPGTYAFCKAHPGVLPLKGSDLVEPYALSVLGQGEAKRGLAEGRGLTLLRVNTDYWETDLQGRLDNLTADQPGALSLCADAAADKALLDDLLNGQLGDDKDRRGDQKCLWVKRSEHAPNDLRDATRYGLCLAQAFLDERGGVYPEHIATQTPRKPKSAPAIAARPDGRPWFDDRS